MKKIDRIRREAESTMKKIREISKHIQNVKDNCLILGEKLIERGEMDIGKLLIANGHMHDVGKFLGIEFEFLAPGVPTKEDEAKLKLKLAIKQHNSTNRHHPEYWGGIHNMPRVAVAEMLCDWKSRSEEFGTSVRDYIDNIAPNRYGYTKESPVYKMICEFADLLCVKPFEAITQS